MKLTRNNRIQVTKSKTCNNKLPIVTGRYQGVIIQDRICNECDVGMLGDEYHIRFHSSNEEILKLCCMYSTFQNISLS